MEGSEQRERRKGRVPDYGVREQRGTGARGGRTGREARPGSSAGGLSPGPGRAPVKLASAALLRPETGLWPEQQLGHKRLNEREQAGVQLPPGLSWC